LDKFGDKIGDLIKVVEKVLEHNRDLSSELRDVYTELALERKRKN
jgi:hypothetical protein